MLAVPSHAPSIQARPAESKSLKNDDPLFAEKCPQFRSLICQGHCHVNFVALLYIREPHNESICTICIFKLLWWGPFAKEKAPSNLPLHKQELYRSWYSQINSHLRSGKSQPCIKVICRLKRENCCLCLIFCLDIC